jgi:Mn2+/Fe2+ NRAMP family transporter
VSELAALDSSAIRPAEAVASPPLRLRIATRGLEIVPGLVTWLLILAPIPLSLRFPQVVGWFVLCFDCYWLYRATELSVGVNITFRRTGTRQDRPAPGGW